MSVRKLWTDVNMDEASSARIRVRGRECGAISFGSEVGNLFSVKNV